jgi:hypothetical protein
MLGSKVSPCCGVAWCGGLFIIIICYFVKVVMSENFSLEHDSTRSTRRKATAKIVSSLERVPLSGLFFFFLRGFAPDGQ